MILFLTLTLLVLLMVVGLDPQQKRRDYLKTGKMR